MTLRMELGADSYDIVLEPGCLREADTYLPLNRKTLIVTDDGVPAQYAQTLAGQNHFVYIVPQGEGSKDFAQLKGILQKMLAEGFGRKDCVVAVGGGMVGDLAGFAASIFMRGVDFYNIPTTLLSQVDSSIGGKTAINLDGVKNIVGAFYQPKKVLIDPETLNTLPAEQLASGAAEAVKMGLTHDPALFARFEQDGTPDYMEVIAASLKIKKSVVEQDEREQGLRRVLNFGHTIGHGIESLGGRTHGECVALGMLPMCAPEVRARLTRVLEKFGLSASIQADRSQVLEAVLHDKKATGEGITTVYVEEPGKWEFRNLSPDDLCERIAMVVTP